MSREMLQLAEALASEKNVDPDVVFDALEFALGTAAKKKSEREQQAQASKARFDAALAKARESGEPILLESWLTTRCMNHHEKECSFDRASRFVNPDGSETISYSCCY